MSQRKTRPNSSNKGDKKSKKELPENFVLDLFELEMDMEKENVPIASVQKLLKQYAIAIEYYEAKKDNKSLVFKNKTQQLLLKENVVKAIEKEAAKKKKKEQQKKEEEESMQLSQKQQKQIQENLDKLKGLDTDMKVEKFKEQTSKNYKQKERKETKQEPTENKNTEERFQRPKARSFHNFRQNRKCSHADENPWEKLQEDNKNFIYKNSSEKNEQPKKMNLNAATFGNAGEEQKENKIVKKLNFNAKEFDLKVEKFDAFVQKKAVEKQEDDDVNFLLDDYLKTGKKPKKVNNKNKKNQLKKQDSKKEVEQK